MKKTFKGIKLNSISNTLKAVLALFGPKGKHWIVGAYQHKGNYCLVGGLRKVDGPFQAEATELLSKTINSLSPDPSEETVINFNDSRKKFGSVKKVLEKTIRKAEKLEKKRAKQELENDQNDSFSDNEADLAALEY